MDRTDDLTMQVTRVVYGEACAEEETRTASRALIKANCMTISDGEKAGQCLVKRTKAC